jgi:hypothetical protein
MEFLSPEWTAESLRPVARWVLQKDDKGSHQLVMVWGTPKVSMSALAGSQAVRA